MTEHKISYQYSVTCYGCGITRSKEELDDWMCTTSDNGYVTGFYCADCFAKKVWEKKNEPEVRYLDPTEMGRSIALAIKEGFEKGGAETLQEASKWCGSHVQINREEKE